jgi:hypothetical protein
VIKIGDRLLTKVDGTVKECIVERLEREDIYLNDEGNTITRKYWEVRIKSTL